MRFQVDDATRARDLVRFFRRQGYLAVASDDGTVDAMPIDAVSEHADRARTLRDLGVWQAEHPDVTVRPLEGPAPT